MGILLGLEARCELGVTLADVVVLVAAAAVVIVDGGVGCACGAGLVVGVVWIQLFSGADDIAVVVGIVGIVGRRSTRRSFRSDMSWIGDWSGGFGPS